MCQLGQKRSRTRIWFDRGRASLMPRIHTNTWILWCWRILRLRWKVVSSMKVVVIGTAKFCTRYCLCRLHNLDRASKWWTWRSHNHSIPWVPITTSQTVSSSWDRLSLRSNQAALRGLDYWLPMVQAWTSMMEQASLAILSLIGMRSKSTLKRS